MNAATTKALVPFAIILCSLLPRTRGVFAVFVHVCLTRLLMRLQKQYRLRQIRDIPVTRNWQAVLRLHQGPLADLYLAEALEILPNAGITGDCEWLKILCDFGCGDAKGNLLRRKLKNNLPVRPSRLH